LFTESPVENI